AFGSVISVEAPFRTVTLTPADVPVAPDASRATAVRVWMPFAAVVVSQHIAPGEAVSSAPRFDPSSLNWTPAAPPSSDAEAVTANAVCSVSRGPGDVISTEGGLLTVTDSVLGVPTFPAASRAVAVSPCVPAAAVV